jgi:hypothetical protein
MTRRRDRRARRARERVLAAEHRARHAALVRRACQPALWRWGRTVRPGERGGHQVSTAHFQAAYPAVAEAGLGSRGVYIGRDLHGGSFCFDPWVLYQAGQLHDANMLVVGRPGYGKSALLKTWMWRSRVFGRTCEVIDPKGEYEQLIRAIGGVVLRLAPGGRTRLNPLERVGGRELREGVLEAIACATLARPLAQAEAVGLCGALTAADRHRDGAPTCLPDVLAQLREPGRELAEQLGMSTREAQLELRECALALQRLCDGPLRGMFDAPTSASERAWNAPGVCLDLSALGAGPGAGNLAVAIVMVCASAFLDAKRSQRAARARRRGTEPQKTIRVNDEAWRALPISGLGDYYQAAFKLSRQTGVQHALALHRLSDLKAAGDEGTRQQRLAEGLLSEASTTVIYRQHTQELAQTTDALGLSETVTERIARLPPGVALWTVGGRCFEVRHLLSDREWQLIDTDTAMGTRHATPQQLELLA